MLEPDLAGGREGRDECGQWRKHQKSETRGQGLDSHSQLDTTPGPDVLFYTLEAYTTLTLKFLFSFDMQ